MIFTLEAKVNVFHTPSLLRHLHPLQFSLRNWFICFLKYNEFESQNDMLTVNKQKHLPFM